MILQSELRPGTVVTNICNPVGGVFLETHGKNLAERVRHDFCAVQIIRIDENTSLTRHDVHQASEAELDFVEAGKDIGVVKLDIIDDDGFGEVMKKFGPFVEKSRVV